MINLVMIIHCHQPVGNFHKVFELAHENCYRPILDILHDHPGIQLGLHYSGCLFEWLDEHRPETMDLIAEMVKRGQVELLSGGFFEPLLATIPGDDARGQIDMLNQFLESRFERRPNGFWLTERIWDPGLPAVIHGTGMEYTVVDDTHFYYAGITHENIYGYYLTEKEGRILKILATPMIMRYLIPFKLVPDVIGHLRWQHELGRDLAVYGDDGEKFGLWPGTHEWVIKKGWLRDFFTAVEENHEWLKAVSPSTYLKEHKPIGRIYMPQASYEEMTEWALPANRGRELEGMIQTLKNENRWDAWRPFVRGGVWDNFLVKYEETNRMHKKAVYLSARASETGLENAKQHVWRAQCNCAYWHGVFGGLYLGHLRRAIHENLVAAHELLRNRNETAVELHQLDIDKDGFDEFIIEGPGVSIGVDPAEGGSLFDISWFRGKINFSDVLTRRYEAYHDKLKDAIFIGGEGDGNEVVSIHDAVLTKEEGLDRYLVYDSYARASLIDHFFEREVGAEDLANRNYDESGCFARNEYAVAGSVKESDRVVLELAAEGGESQRKLSIKKTITAGCDESFSVGYVFESGSDQLTGFYGCEFNLNMFSDEDGDRYLFAPDHDRRREVYERGNEYGLKSFELVNRTDGVKIRFTFDKSVSAAFWPLMSVSMSEEGFEKSYQGTSLMFFAPLNISSGGNDDFRIKIEIIEL